MNIKQYIIIRKDLKLRRGKEISQGSHASIHFLTSRILKMHSMAFWETGDIQKSIEAKFPEVQLKWMQEGQTKITLQIDSEQALLDIYQQALSAKLEVHLIKDAGHTEFHGVPTYTALAIGPDYEDKINPITKDLKLY